MSGFYFSQDDLARLSAYAAKYGDEGLGFIHRMKETIKTFSLAIQEGNNYHGLKHAWDKHYSEWLQIDINTKDELFKLLKNVSENGEKIAYKQYSNGAFVGNRIGFYNKERNILIVADDGGNMVTAFRPTDGWEYIQSLEYLFQF